MIADYLITTEQEIKVAKTASQALDSHTQDKPVRLLVVDGEHEIKLSAGILRLIRDILKAMVAGHIVTLIPQHAKLTTKQAADILNVSHLYLIKLLEQGEIPHHKVGRHRRILMEDLMQYKEESRRKSAAILDELVAEAQELGLYD